MGIDSRDHRLPDGSVVDWTRDANFVFVTEVEALEQLTELGDELRAAREQVRHISRYLHAAVRAAAAVREDDEPISRTAIINHSGLARQTVYTMLGDDPA